MPTARLLLLAAALSLLASGAPAAAPAPTPGEASTAWVAEHYTKYKYRIPMRDGVRLFTRVLVPKDQSQAWPILFIRTPYAVKPYGADNYPEWSSRCRTFATAFAAATA